MDRNSTKLKLLVHTMGKGYRKRRPPPAEFCQSGVTLPSCTKMQGTASTEGQAALASHLTASPHSPRATRVITEKVRGPTSPAGPNHERRFPPGWVDETIVMDESGVEGDAIGVERDCGELEVQGIVVPFVVTHLGVQSEHSVMCSPRN